MAIVCRLREYKAKEEFDSERLLRHVGLGSTVLVSAAALILTFSFWDGEKGGGAAVVPGAVSRAAKVDSPFIARNWTHLENKPKPILVNEPGVQDLSAPEWAGREVFKDLKAMPVYEVQDPHKDRESMERIATMMENGGHL